MTRLFGRKKSIARRYFFSVATIVILCMLLLGTIFLVTASRYFRGENFDNLRAALKSVGEVLDATADCDFSSDGNASVAERNVDLTARIANANILIACGDGRIAYVTPGLPVTGDRLSDSFLQEMQAGEYFQISSLSGLLSHRYYVIGQRYTDAAGTDWYLVSISNAGRFAGYLSNLVFMFFWICLLMLLISAVIALVTAHRISAPLDELSKAADSFGKGDFSARVSIAGGGDDEIAKLAQNFNRMANGLETIDRSRQSFMGNIAHELRTPMTSIKGFIDGMLDGVIPPEQYPKYLGLVSDEVARLTRLIQRMLDITKLEAGEYAVNAKNYDIWETLGAVLMNSERRLLEGHIGIIGFVPQRTLVYADPDLIYQVVYNIVDNAIKFTPPGGSITLNVSPAKGRVNISLRNTGDGVPAEQLPYLFERFYKADKSRGLHASGAGLGMHISKVLIGVSGGSIYVHSDSASWTEFGFDLPQGHAELPPPPRRSREGKGNIIKFRSRSKG